MDKAVTVGGVVTVLLIFGGIVGLGGLCLFILSLLNPFRSGH